MISWDDEMDMIHVPLQPYEEEYIPHRDYVHEPLLLSYCCSMTFLSIMTYYI